MSLAHAHRGGLDVTGDESLSISFAPGSLTPGGRLHAEAAWLSSTRGSKPSWSYLLDAGKSIRWVADQLGHADPALTLRVYAHAIREEEPGLSFADFGGSERLYTSPSVTADFGQVANPPERLVGPRGLEPRTVGLKARCSTN